ncbi:serine hydrolase [Mycobacterium sp. NAZ190054]|uniref:serine hydrolase domain-containing protein n=1 Tax=Mycobacterium sp. NAZ190054 TaxID=1747766 RepID=UPI00079548E9|nr:serine hydrolase domain-containing protein [Mycobacterium sp. NAZ190054]KWX67785.1 serine hydrolase [Mycobacterium sp. NAZ190054]
MTSVMFLVSGISAIRVAAQPADLTARLDTVIAAKVAEMGVPGAIVSFAVPGLLDYTTAVGVADTDTGAPMTVDAHHRIGSVTKTFTATAVLQLVDEGRVRLDDPISRYVPGVPSGDVITLDLLGRMRSGLPDYSENPAFVDQLYRLAPTGPDAFAFTPRELIDAAFTQPMNFAPGAEYQYSNTNYVLLGMVVEKITGQRLGEYFAQRFFGPGGLTRTTYPRDGRMPLPFAHGYNKAPDGTVHDASLWNPTWADAAGEIVSTVGDLRNWALTLGRGTLLSPAMTAERLQRLTPAAPGVGYGFGIFDSHGWIGHNGDIPGYATVLVYLPARDATLVVAVNSDVPEQHSAGQLAQALTSIVTPEHVYDLADASPGQQG